MRRRVPVVLMLVPAVLVGCGGLPPLPGMPAGSTATPTSSGVPTSAVVSMAASPRAAASASQTTARTPAVAVASIPPSASVASAPPATRPPAVAVSPTTAGANSATLAASGTTPSTMASTGLVVTFTESDPVNMRAMPSTMADVVLQVDPGSDADVIEASVPGLDGGPPWIHITYMGKMGYVRSDVTGPPHPKTVTTTAGAMPSPTP